MVWTPLGLMQSGWAPAFHLSPPGPQGSVKVWQPMVVYRERRSYVILDKIHVILDNLSTHKTKLVEAFLQEHLNVTLRFTPTYSSWLNQVELWFRRFSGTCCRAASSRRRRIWRGSCGGTSTSYSKRARLFRWKYGNPAQRITHGEHSSRTVH